MSGFSPTPTAEPPPWGDFSLALEQEDDRATLRATGPGALELFGPEAGGHRFQRCPPTERSGRRHSSTVTVAVRAVAGERAADLREADLEEQFCRGSGAGGQNRNKRDTCVLLRHLPTGLAVREESQRTQESNRRLARERLAAALAGRAEAEAAAAAAREAREQRGSGERSDKVRTYQLDADRAIDHRTGRRCRWRDFARGDLALLR